ncbi:Protein kinase-like domain protein [Niveomyces insectorum RCEF 264]|uniref:Protein kinase-like domain protein n=1 Tax=Niveomyces insectorum RCEF 264 TaxID=1081102 RepID=A0A162JAB0_9HYPO|nr:Protein kinase-like domain protein [Niveomyces insectorum RCEF 264]
MPRIISPDELKNAKRFGTFAPVYQIDDRTVVKTGESVALTEAETMAFARQHTTIPVPDVHNAYTDETSGYACIVMDFVPGRTLDEAWPTYTEADKDAVLAQLRGYLAELRAHRGDFVGGLGRTPCNDPLFDNEKNGYGPFADEAAFNQGVVRALRNARPGQDWVELYCDVFEDVMQGHDIVLTHGDLDPRNILVQGAQVVALLDWEMAGYYPAYWEYCKAMRRPRWESGWVKDRAVDRILPPWRKELSVIWNLNEVIW